MNILVTGCSGYIGTRLIRLLRQHHHEIIAASRHPQEKVAAWTSFDLNEVSIIEFPDEVDVVIHLAVNTAELIDDRQHEIDAAKVLIAAAKKVGAKFIFVSSQTAREDAPTSYGRSKWSIEQKTLAAKGIVVRPGQVYGGREQGLFGKLTNIVRRLPVLPAFWPQPKVQPIHVDDLAKALLLIAESAEVPSGILCLAATEPLRFSDFLSAIASARVRQKRYFLPTPAIIVKALRFLAGVRLGKRLGLEQLHSLFELPLMETQRDLQKLQLTLRPLLSGMHPSGDDSRRHLLLEGRALMTYILRTRPSSSLMRRYVYAIEGLRDGAIFGLPGYFLKFPFLLPLLDGGSFAKSIKGRDFSWRLDAATMLAEASPQGAVRFLGVGQKTGLTNSLIRISRSVFYEFIFCLMRLILTPFCLLYSRKLKERA